MKNSKLKIRASIGSLGLLGFSKIKMDALPTTLYLMVNEKCLYNCGYCPQARVSESETYEKLSRVVWPEVDWEEMKKVILLKKDFYHRICFQVVNGKNYLENTLYFLEELNSVKINKPISVSIRLKNFEELNKIFKTGVDRVGLPLDVASKKNYSKIRGGSFESAKKFIITASKSYPGRITTHLIVGLGDSDKEIYKIMKEFFENGVLVSLFAFTPIKGTLLEKLRLPSLSRYRKAQLMRYLLSKKIDFKANFDEHEMLDFIKIEDMQILKNPDIYITSGCPGCNRPYYNETPKGPMYNFPFKPEVNDEILKSYIENANNGKITFKKL